MTSLKSAICSAADRLGMFPIGRAMLHLAYGNNYVRAVNYHATPADEAGNLREQLRFYRRNFTNVTPADLQACIEGRRDRLPKPGLIISFDDGYRSNFDVAAPILEEHGFTGWFFVSSGRIGESDVSQPDGRAAPGETFMSLEDMRSLHERGHVVGCHTHSHVRLSDELGIDRLHDEIVVSRHRLEQALGFEVDTFCWVGGEEGSYGALGARLVAEGRYRFAFTTNLAVLRPGTAPLVLDRTNIESGWPMSHVRFYLSGAMDLAYAAKRRRVEAKLRRGFADAAQLGRPTA